MSSELVVRLKNGELAKLEKYENELCVGRRTMHMNDLINSLLNMTEDVELFRLLSLEHEDQLVRLYDLLFEDQAEEAAEILFNRVSEHLLGRFWDKQIHGWFAHILTPLLKRLDIQEIDKSKSLIKFLGALVNKVEKMDDETTQVYNELFKILLTKINVNEHTQAPVADFLKLVTQRIEGNNKEELRNIFLAIAEKCDKRWLEEFLATQKRAIKVWETPILSSPYPCIHYKEITGGGHVYTIEVPKAKRDVYLYGKKIKQVGHPRLLFMFAVKDEMIVDMRLCAVKEHEFLNAETKLYRYPFSNVYENFGVCWGYRQQRVQGFYAFPQIIGDFFNSPNSNHGRGNIKEIFESLQNKDFNDDSLMPTDFTLGQLLGK